MSEILVIKSKEDLNNWFLNLAHNKGDIKVEDYNKMHIEFSTKEFTYRISVSNIQEAKETGSLDVIRKAIKNMKPLATIISTIKNDSIVNTYSILSSTEQITGFLSKSSQVNLRYTKGTITEKDVKYLTFFTFNISASRNQKTVSDLTSISFGE